MGVTVGKATVTVELFASDNSARYGPNAQYTFGTEENVELATVLVLDVVRVPFVTSAGDVGLTKL
jgi:hypothetical protein